MLRNSWPRALVTISGCCLFLLLAGRFAPMSYSKSFLRATEFGAENRATDVKNQNEITQLSNAVEAFKRKFCVNYIPSKIKLYPALTLTTDTLPGYYNLTTSGGVPANQLEFDSYAYLTLLWPRIAGNKKLTGWGPSTKNGVILEGEECLVFFLGGMQATNPNRCLGWSTDPTDLTATTSVRIGPFFDFDSNRLAVRPGVGSGVFFTYADAYGSAPYAYFSSYKHANGYNRYFANMSASDCASLGVWPYARHLGTAPSYFNPDSHQIISAGANRTFGQGSNQTFSSGNTWSRQAPTEGSCLAKTGTTSPTAPGEDDQCNFHDRLMGIPE
jgi:hypothetical protein